MYTVPAPNGDTISVCDICGHALEGFSPEDAGLNEYSRATLEGTVFYLTLMNKNDTYLHDAERSDSNLIPRCDVCKTPKSPFQWYSIYEARPNNRG